MESRNKAGLVGAGAVVSLLASLTACGPTLEMRPEAETLAPTVSVVVSMPTSVDFGGPGDQRRLQRRVGDRLLELTGGKVVVAEELTQGDDDASVRQAVAALGEDAASAVTFSLHVGDGRRIVNNANPISSFNATRRLVVDFRARVEVRRLGAADVIGSVEAIASGPPNQSENRHRGGEARPSRGHRRGLGRGGEIVCAAAPHARAFHAAGGGAGGGGWDGGEAARYHG